MTRRLGDWETSDSRIVISSEARNLLCRPINDACVKAEIRSTKALFRTGAYVILTAVQERSLGYARDDDTGNGESKFENEDEKPQVTRRLED